MRLALMYFFGLSILFVIGTERIVAQESKPPFWDEIQAFKKEDSIHPPMKNAILFVGSSSFNYWKTVQKDFPGYRIVNRGFGGSSLPDVIRYQDDIIYPYKPKQVVIYCGENDLAASDTVSAATVVNRFRQLFTSIRKHLPNVPIVFVSIKPSPSRQHLMPKMDSANKMVLKFLKQYRHTAFVDVYHKMLNPDGTPKQEIFRDDKLHMNPKGYSIWIKAIKPHLLK